MQKIEFRNNKTLKISNVLFRKATDVNILSQEKHLEVLQNWIEAKGYHTLGPLIVYTSAAQGLDDVSMPIIHTSFMIQLTNNIANPEPPYGFEKLIRVENCLFTRFNGKAEDINFASMKMQLHAYENDVELTGETYTVVIEETTKEGLILADVFMPTKPQE